LKKGKLLVSGKIGKKQEEYNILHLRGRRKAWGATSGEKSVSDGTYSIHPRKRKKRGRTIYRGEIIPA